MNDLEAKVRLIETHLERCTKATSAFRAAFANWHASAVLERPSEPQRWAELQAASAAMGAAVDDMHADFPGDDDEGDDDTYDPDDSRDREYDEAIA
jgi:hypothetical protein